MIRIQNLSKSYGAQPLFDEATFNINPREKIGLVGRNGHGKTTLMRIITGEEHPDEGVVDIDKNYRIGFITQHLKFTSDTVIGEAASGLPEHEKDEVYRAEKILSGLGFTEGDFQRSPAEFSGGFQVRLHLAKVLVSHPDLLLLDEPTNYLDITSIRWLEGFLRQWAGELILITHDRSFMDSCVTHTVGIHRRKVRKIEGDTSKLYEQIAREEEVYEKTRINDEKKRKEVEVFINRFRAKARLAGLVQSRIKNLERMEKRDRLEKIEALEFSFHEAPFAAKYMMHADSITFGYTNDKPLIHNFSLNIARGDRICVIGKNGKGKSTLLRLLCGDLAPWSGTFSAHPEVRNAYFAQTNVKSLEPNRTVEEEIQSVNPSADRQKARGIAGAMMFEGDAALKKVAVLSGGEKSRVMLGKIIMKPANILFLDEPTNHLDMHSCDALLEAIDGFDGAVVIVTHNEMFLHAIANRLVVFQGDGMRVVDGGYEYFLEKIGWDEEGPVSVPENSSENEVITNKRELRKIRSEIITRRNKIMKPIDSNIESHEKNITQSESRLKDVEQELVDAATAKDGSKIELLSKEMHQLKTNIETLYNELDVLYAEKETNEKSFEAELGAIAGQDD